MEVAAERIRSVKKLLPERPHHLALSLGRKYPVPPNFWDHQSPLQYSTFLSDADRGLLLTRPYYDICDEPEAPVPTRQSTPQAGAKKAGSKMTLEVWKSKKVATSPTENGVLGRVEDKKQRVSAHGPEKDVSRREHDKVKQAGTQRDGKGSDPRGNGDADRPKSSISKVTSRDVPSPSSEGKKRPLEQDDSTRPLKKTKSSEPTSSEAPRKAPRPEAPSGRERAMSASKDGRTGALQSNPSGRAAQPSSKDQPRAVSPKTTVNGTKPQSSASRNTLPPKPDTSGKHLVPPILSPLKLAFDDDLETWSSKKKVAEGHMMGKSQNKPSRPEGTVKKRAATPELPPILSPTLPPQVEEALARIQKTQVKEEAKDPPGQSSDAAAGARKTRPPADNCDAEARPAKLVTIKYKKTLRKRIQSLLALPSRPWPKERSLSADNTPPPASKRPRGTEPIAEPVTSSVGAKRPRAPETTGSKAPHTPPKPPTANSLAAPGGSQTHTPGGRVAQTPGTGDAAQTGREGTAKETLRRRWDEFCKIGKKLKHKRDKEFPANAAGQNAAGQLRDYRRAMLTIEMILAYMIAFRSLNQRSEISGAAMDMASWLTLEPHLRELKQMARHSGSLQALAYQLHGIVINELIRAFASVGLHGGEQLKLGKDQHMAVFQAMKNNPRIWTEANDLRGKVSDKSLRTPTMGTWTTPHRAASDALQVLARFAEREHVNWRAEMVVPNEGA
ncbi:hypothetical protein KVR01_009733 [Diaporthe batatas]|uniref:uncharacterized protein n=1 Tax=Diaporthe batatas TaxID=748121 RepID=UPI001D04CA3F|nr:uncharacterized protein KVR01_009733 [Diaporthe batatas]KAG8160197.1 hypothetical protein KVR01_009733 [Diaporthe batatas]